MDKRALYEIENAIRKAKARLNINPIFCINCMREMEVHDRYVVCWHCRIIHWQVRPGMNKWTVLN